MTRIDFARVVISFLVRPPLEEFIGMDGPGFEASVVPADLFGMWVSL